MHTKILVLGFVAIVPLMTACSADASGDDAIAGSDALQIGPTQLDGCDPSGPVCECHTVDACNAMRPYCVASGGRMSCSDPGNSVCLCTYPARTSPVGGIRPPSTSGAFIR
ncbi:MAG TPA: hypothetical protein VIF62_30060 [Labilithrix sp.]|jgi:hypothetical protein